MIYQKILTDERPYQMTIGHLAGFDEHRHADLEFNFCLEGEFEIIVEKKRYKVEAGQMSLIRPMASHGIPPSDESRRVITVVVGSTFLKKYFPLFSAVHHAPTVLRLDGGTHEQAEIRRLFEECAELFNSNDKRAELLMTGNLYKICGYLLSELPEDGTQPAQTTDLRMVANIECALEMIYYDYPKPITVEAAAAATGYGKSNFCKVFKSVVGESFHKALNRQRVRSACGLLSETDIPVSAVAEEVGFGEAKTFCRVFGQIMGMTPGEYRRKERS